jgi:hypothetical protein
MRASLVTILHHPTLLACGRRDGARKKASKIRYTTREAMRDRMKDEMREYRAKCARLEISPAS